MNRSITNPYIYLIRIPLLYQKSLGIQSLEYQTRLYLLTDMDLPQDLIRRSYTVFHKITGSLPGSFQGCRVGQ